MRIGESKESSHSGVLSQLCGLDLRSLALFRVTIAIVVLADLVDRARNLGAFYTDAGVLRRGDLLEAFPWLHEWSVCIHLAGGAWWTQAMFFLLHGAAALLLLVGYRTTLSTIVVWLLTTSVQLRNLYVGHGSDAELRMMLFWGCFLPLGARYSVDSTRRSPAEQPRSAQFVSVGTVALILQIVSIYLASGTAKWQEPLWRQGAAVSLVLNNDLWATSVGWLLLRWPTVCVWLTHAVLAVELLAPVLLVVPVFVGPIRTLTVLTLCALHLGFALGLKLGLFPWVSIASVTCLLPGWFWERAARIPALLRLWDRAARTAVSGAQRVAESFGVSLTPGSSEVSHAVAWRSGLREAVCAVFFIYLVVWNVGVFRDRAYEAPAWMAWLGGSVFLQQDWRMFASVASRTGWLMIPATLKDGTQVDLFADGGPLPDLEGSRNGSVLQGASESLREPRDNRWRAFLDRLAFGKRGDQQLLLYGRYLCREWNRHHEGAKQLDSLQIYFRSRAVEPLSQLPQSFSYEDVLLWTHWCFK